MILLGLALAGQCGLTLVAQAKQLPPLRFEHLSVEHGLSQSTVFTIVQDRSGYLWFGTEDGLNRFDGYEFTVHRRGKASGSISDNWISALYEDRKGVLWVATRKGVDRWDRRSRRFIHFPAPLPGKEAWCFFEDNVGRLWLGTDAGLYRINSAVGSLTHFPVVPELPHEVGVRSILLDGNGNLLLATWGRGLVRFDPRHLAMQQIPTSEEMRRLRVVYRDRGGKIWVGGDHGLGAADLSKLRVERRPIPGSKNARMHVTSLFESEAGYLWVGTWGHGVYILSPDRKDMLRLRRDTSNPKSLSHDTVWAFYQDRSGVLWVGSGTGGGLNRLVTRSGFQSYRFAPAEPVSLSNDQVWAIQQDEDGVLWVGTSEGLDRLERASGLTRRFRSKPEDSSTLSSSRVWALAPAGEGKLWVGTQGHGLNLLDEVTGKVRRLPLGGSMGTSGPNAVRALRTEPNGRLWIGTHGGGLARLNPRTGEIVRFRNDPKDPQTLADDRVWALALDRRGMLWIGMDGGGLDRFDPASGEIRHYRHRSSDPTSLGSDRVWAIHVGGRDIWVGTHGGGLSRLDPGSGRFQRFTEENSGLPNDTVYGILEDEFGNLWLSTNRGISCLNSRTGEFRNFDVGQGLEGNEFNFGAYHRGRDGEMFFGGVHGLTAFRPRRLLEPSRQVPPVAITGFSKLGTAEMGEVSSGSRLRLAPNENFFTFTFAVLDYRNPRRNLYSYQLKGVDADWRLAEASDRRASYTLVKPGEYVFQVRGANSEGVWNRKGVAVQVIVEPPFWRTPGFLLLVSFFLLSLTAAWRAYRRGLELEAARMLEQGREIEREALAQEIHDGPIQEIVDLAHRIDRLTDEGKTSTPSWQRVTTALGELRHELTRMSERLRDLCWSLRPPTLDAFGLESAMREHLDVLLSRSETPPQVDFTFESLTSRLPADVELQLFRIFQSAIRNALQHAEATVVCIHFQADESTVALEVADDGKGFTPPKRLVQLARERHYGLLGIEERASVIGGSMKLDSSPGNGTVIKVDVNLESWISKLHRQRGRA